MVAASVQLVPAGKGAIGGQAEGADSTQGGDGFSSLLSLLGGAAELQLSEESKDVVLQDDINLTAEALISAQALFVVPPQVQNPVLQASDIATQLIPDAAAPQILSENGLTLPAEAGGPHNEAVPASKEVPVLPLDAEPVSKEEAAQAKPVQPLIPEAALTKAVEASEVKETKATSRQENNAASPKSITAAQQPAPVITEENTLLATGIKLDTSQETKPVTVVVSGEQSKISNPAPVVADKPQAPAKLPAPILSAAPETVPQHEENLQDIPASTVRNVAPATDIKPVVDVPLSQAAAVQAVAPRNTPLPQPSHINAEVTVTPNAEKTVVLDFNASQSGTQQGQTQSGMQQLTIQPVTNQPNAPVAHEANFARHLEQAGYPSPAEQVQVQIRNLTHDGSSKIRIELQPAELGKVEISLHVSSDGKTSVHVTTDTRAALDALQRDARGLERALTDSGLKADAGSLNFSLRGEQQDPQGKRYNNAYAKKKDEEEELAPIGAVVNQTLEVTVDSSLDISI